MNINVIVGRLILSGDLALANNLNRPALSCRGKASRVFSPVSVIFKGSGFYITDNREKESGSAS